MKPSWFHSPPSLPSPEWGPLTRMGQQLRVQARLGYRAAVVELDQGLYLVAEVPEDALRPLFGAIPLLGTLLVQAASLALSRRATARTTASARGGVRAAPIHPSLGQARGGRGRGGLRLSPLREDLMPVLDRPPNSAPCSTYQDAIEADPLRFRARSRGVCRRSRRHPRTARSDPRPARRGRGSQALEAPGRLRWSSATPCSPPVCSRMQSPDDAVGLAPIGLAVAGTVIGAGGDRVGGESAYQYAVNLREQTALLEARAARPGRGEPPGPQPPGLRPSAHQVEKHGRMGLGAARGPDPGCGGPGCAPVAQEGGMTPRRFRLSFVNPTEDQPRLIRAYGRTRAGEVALVMRPALHRALLVWIPKQGETVVWCPRADEERSRDDPGHGAAGRAYAATPRGRATPSEPAGRRPLWSFPASLPHGHRVSVVLEADGTAQLTLDGDSPLAPTEPMEPKRAIGLVRARTAPDPPGWPGDTPGSVERRAAVGRGPAPGGAQAQALTSYGTLWVRSHGAQGWSWAFERDERWFAEPGRDEEHGLATLAEALQAGMLGALQLVREACSQRDTRRRAALDPDYATKHPLPTPRPGRDPFTTLKPPSARRRGTTPPPKPLDEDPAPELQTTPCASRRRGQRLLESAADLEPTAPGRRARQGSTQQAEPSKHRPARERASLPGRPSAVDPDKDQALLDAFRTAIAATLGAPAPPS